MSPETTMDRAAIYELFASESDREARRRMEGLGTVLALLPVCAVAWAYALGALIDLIRVL